LFTGNSDIVKTVDNRIRLFDLSDDASGINFIIGKDFFYKKSAETVGIRGASFLKCFQGTFNYPSGRKRRNVKFLPPVLYALFQKGA